MVVVVIVAAAAVVVVAVVVVVVVVVEEEENLYDGSTLSKNVIVTHRACERQLVESRRHCMTRSARRPKKSYLCRHACKHTYTCVDVHTHTVYMYTYMYLRV